MKTQCAGQSRLHEDLLRYHPLRRKAAALITQAVRKGLLPPARTLICVDCGKQARDYDHRDYSKPLNVNPVCRGCNLRRGSGKFAFKDEVA